MQIKDLDSGRLVNLDQLQQTQQLTLLPSSTVAEPPPVIPHIGIASGLGVRGAGVLSAKAGGKNGGGMTLASLLTPRTLTRKRSNASRPAAAKGSPILTTITRALRLAKEAVTAEQTSCEYRAISLWRQSSRHLDLAVGFLEKEKQRRAKANGSGSGGGERRTTVRLGGAGGSGETTPDVRKLHFYSQVYTCRARRLEAATEAHIQSLQTPVCYDGPKSAFGTLRASAAAAVALLLTSRSRSLARAVDERGQHGCAAEGAGR